MNDINVITASGRLTKDPELRFTQSGTPVCSFSIANNKKFKEKETVSFFNCVAWGKLGELINEYCQKGKDILIVGRLEQRTWESQDGSKKSTIEIVVSECKFGSKPGIESMGKEVPKSEVPGIQGVFSDDDIPF